MLVDVSEVKTFRTCTRKWAFSSRNMMHLRSIKMPPALALGIAFHKGIELIYMGMVPGVNELSNRYELTPTQHRILENMLGGYLVEAYPADKERFKVLDTEYKFEIPSKHTDIIITGSIDMIVKERGTGKIFGFEHKSVKNFRPNIYDTLDEQPQLYFNAIKKDFGRCDGMCINQVRKLKTKFDMRRVWLTYTDKQISDFMRWFEADALNIKNCIEWGEYPAKPSYMGCTMCQYSDMCEKMQKEGISCISEFDDPNKLALYGLERREIDHLEEK